MFARSRLADRSVEKWRLFSRAERGTGRQLVKGDVFLPFQEGQEYSTLEKLVFQKKIAM